MKKAELMKKAEQMNITVDEYMTVKEIKEAIKEAEQKESKKEMKEEIKEEIKEEQKEAEQKEEQTVTQDELMNIIFESLNKAVISDEVEIRVMKDKSLAISKELKDVNADADTKHNRLYVVFRLYKSAKNKYRITTTVKSAIAELDNVQTVVKKSSNQTYYKITDMNRETVIKQIKKIKF